MNNAKVVAVSGSFDDLRSPQIRFLEEASKFGLVHVLLWPDAVVQSLNGKPPKFPLEERRYLLENIRYVTRVVVPSGGVEPDALPLHEMGEPAVWAVEEGDRSEQKRTFAKANGIMIHVIPMIDLAGFPAVQPPSAPSGRKKVIVTGCFDWFHSGHVRFFEEVSALGDLYVVVGSDTNVRFLKGEGHPLFPQDERRYVIQSIRFVTQALISTGAGWMDAEPEIAWIQPDIYAVNEDGDKPEKREFCQSHGLEYVVLKRLPKPGLHRRQSTDLRGF
jgi:cytidyltransferase-like protein